MKHDDIKRWLERVFARPEVRVEVEHEACWRAHRVTLISGKESIGMMIGEGDQVPTWAIDLAHLLLAAQVRCALAADNSTKWQVRALKAEGHVREGMQSLATASAPSSSRVVIACQGDEDGDV